MGVDDRPHPRPRALVLRLLVCYRSQTISVLSLLSVVPASGRGPGGGARKELLFSNLQF